MDLPVFIRENVPLAPLTTFGIGGPARWFAEPSSRDELIRALRLAGEWGTDVYILGGGSNLLIADDGVDGMVVRLSPMGEFGMLRMDDDDPLSWTAGPAVPLSMFVLETVRAGVSGLEKMAGIPGTVGGAVAMNAGSADGGIGSTVSGGTVCRPDGTVQEFSRDDFRFTYRSSALLGGVGLAFSFRFQERADPESLAEAVRGYRERKRASQPLTLPSAGCVFRNPPGDSAGALLDAAGCKGMREGGVAVSTVHANFIVNPGRGTSGDVRRLAARMRDMVYRKNGIVLQPEVRAWGMGTFLPPLDEDERRGDCA